MALSSPKSWVHLFRFYSLTFIVFLSFIIFLSLFLFLGNTTSSYAYFGLYGGPYVPGAGGWYGPGGLYRGLGFYGPGTYGGLYGLYGPGGDYLYARGLFAGLYGLFGLAGPRIYGLGGLGFYGMSGLYGLGSLGGLVALNTLAGPGNKASPTLPGTIASSLAVPVIAAAEQAGAWEGEWFSIVKNQAGIINLELVENPFTGKLSGTCIMLLNRYISGPVEVSGALDPETGSYVLIGTYFDFSNLIEYSLELDCTLTDPESITGQYTIHDLLYTRADIGKFNLSLIAPAITAPGGIPTALAPGTLNPALLIPTAITPTLGASPTGITTTGPGPTLTAPPVITLPLGIPTILNSPIVSPLVITPSAPAAAPAVTSGLLIPWLI